MMPSNPPNARSPLQAWHAGQGATWVQQEGWSVPAFYSSVAAEIEAAQTGLALADISSFTKINVRGRNLVQSLLGDNTPPGTVLWAAENGGWMCRLAQDHCRLMLPTARSSFNLPTHPDYRPDRVQEVTTHSAGFALFGPKYGKVLSGLTSLDLSPAAFPPGHCAQTGFAGVPALLVATPNSPPNMQLFVAWDVAEYVWDRIRGQAAPESIVPLGMGAIKELWSL